MAGARFINPGLKSGERKKLKALGFSPNLRINQVKIILNITELINNR
jgi:hypothetical protein